MRKKDHSLKENCDKDQTQQKNQFISYKNYLKQKQDKQMQILRRLDYNHSENSIKKKQSDIFKFLKQKCNQESKNKQNYKEQISLTKKQQTIKYKSSYQQNQNQRTNTTDKKLGTKQSGPKKKQQYRQIDSNAVVLKGRLIYLKQDDQTYLKSNDHLLHQLRQNNIKYKQYLCGDQKSIINRISANQSQKEDQIINDYILRNMGEENNGEIVIMDRFYQVKSNIFQ